MKSEINGIPVIDSHSCTDGDCSSPKATGKKSGEHNGLDVLSNSDWNIEDGEDCKADE
jgi:hypothetical protein